MNDFMKLGLIVAGGFVLGCAGAAAAKKKQIDVKEVAARLLSRGMDVKEKLLRTTEGLRADLNDIRTEARKLSAERRAAREA
ncbi:MAG: hypothetical protein E7022_05355 [Desulfovibrio desulfuricans]|jgi:hypothetical protein|nr:hypothetical protein [Desulfovibrio desulfuricans]